MTRRFAIVVASVAVSMFMGASASVAGADTKKASPKTAAELFEALAALPGLDADYREEKFLTVLVDPIVSTGSILFEPPTKLIRVTKAPIWSSLIVEESALSYRDAAGPQKVPAAKGDPARAFVEVFVDVARGNLTALEKTFTVTFTAAPKDKTDKAGKTTGWKLELVPKKKDFGIKRIELGGHSLAIGRMSILDATGDRTEITFTRIDTSKRPSAKRIELVLRKP